MSKEYSRRQFITTSAIVVTATGVLAATGKILTKPSDTELPNPYPVMPDKKPLINSPDKKPLFFNEHQYSLVAALAALIVPTDDDPGASEAGVADYIDRMVAENEKDQNKYSEGLDWIDKVSKEQYSKDFLKLNVREQIALLISIDESESKRYRPVSHLSDRFERKVYEVWNDLFGIGDSSKFFRTLRKHVLYGYYSNPISWKVVGYYGPPQPEGYKDYSEPPSQAKYIATVRQINDKTCQNCHFDQTERVDHEDQNNCMECHEPHFPLHQGL